MTNLLIAMIYKQWGYSVGKPIKVGEGKPSHMALSTFGFAWPIGTILEWTAPGGENHIWRVDEGQLTQLDT